MDQLLIEKNIDPILKKIDRLVKRLNLDCSPTITDDIDNIMRKLKRGKYISDVPKLVRNNNFAKSIKTTSKLVNRSSSNSIKRKIVTLDWNSLVSDVLKCISLGVESFDIPNQLLNLIESEKKGFKTLEDSLIKNEKIRLLEERNFEPIFKGVWRKEPHPPRVYDPLSDYAITDTISNEEKAKINICTSLSDGYLGVPYNYEDYELTQEWIAAFKEKKGKQDVKASEDNIISIQIQKLVESLVDKVYDNFCTESKVLQNGPIELGPYLKEVPVWGIDCFTRRMLELSIEDHVEPPTLYCPVDIKEFIERRLNCAINAQPPNLAHNLTNAINYLLTNESLQLTIKEKAYAQAIAKVISEIGIGDNFRIHPKGTGVICTKEDGIAPEQFVCEYLGELYPPYRWCERLDVIKQAQEKYELKPMLPDFYNILLERPRQDPEGYGILFVDASMKSNMGSTISHSCDANCQSSIVARNGKLSIALTTKRHVQFGEEITHDYHCITNSELEWSSAVCLCSMTSCRGSFLHYATEEDLQQILEQNCGPLWRFAALLKSCSEKPLTQSDKDILVRHGMQSAALSNPANWIKKFVAYNLRFVEFERQALPMKLLRPKNGKPSDYDYESADQDARNVMEQRLQSMTCCFSMVNRVLEMQSDKTNTEPLKVLSVKEAIDEVWKLLEQLPNLLEDHLLTEEVLAKLKKSLSNKSKKEPKTIIRTQIDFIKSILVEKPATIGNMRNSILDIRDSIVVMKDYEYSKARLNLLSDLLALWAFTNNFSTPTEFMSIESDSLVVLARELGSNIPTDIINPSNNASSDNKNKQSKKTEALNPNEPVFTGKKTYDKQFILSQLLNWFHAGTEVTSSPPLLGCVIIPSPSACFGTSEKEYKEDERKYLQNHLNDDRTQMAPWTSTLTKCFNMDMHSSNLYGSPYLDQALGQVDNINNAITLIGGRKIVNKVTLVDRDGPQFDKLLPPESNNAWVQCEKCNKWRRVPWNVDAEKLPDSWECQMNYWDLDKASCESPTDDFDATRELTVDCQNLEKVNEDDLEIGTTWDVLCLELLTYFEATIVSVKRVSGRMKLKFHFLGWEDCFDEWIEANSERIQPHHLHTEVLDEGVTVKYKTASVKKGSTNNKSNNIKKRKTVSAFNSEVYDYSRKYNNSTSSRRSKELDDIPIV